jgi:hypothetical protein
MYTNTIVPNYSFRGSLACNVQCMAPDPTPVLLPYA